jgi:hypothetical protein
MALILNRNVDPLTPASETVAAQVIQSNGMAQLVREMIRYARGEMTGRSYLVAGHRGVGKTTMVRKAFELMTTQLKNENVRMRPLYVELHGPDLVSPIRKPQAAEGGSPGADSESSSSDDETTTAAGTTETPAATTGTVAQVEEDWTNFTERLTFGLYRSAATEFSKRFRAAVQKANPELAGQFEVELDRGADLRRLREFYRAGDALSGGVLFPTFPPDPQCAVREMTLLAGAAQAYWIVSGKLEQTRNQTEKAEQKSTLETTIENLAPPIAGLLSGVLTWQAIPDASAEPVAKLLGSALAGFAGLMTVKLTTSRSRELNDTQTANFVPQTDPESLKRVLPVLVERFFDIGLVPIFVVDELDKIDDVDERMFKVMAYLKQFVTERAFFCFLADRTYFESIESKIAHDAYPKSATLFGERLFVQYRVKDLRDYLAKLLPPKMDTEAEQRELELFPYVLLRRSFLHPFELRRLLIRYTDDKNIVRIPPESMFNNFQYRNDVLIQAAIECVLSETDVSEYVEEPFQAQLAYDTLYFPARQWEQEEPLELTVESLRRHLVSRMGGKERAVPDQEFLYRILELLVGYLVDPKTLTAAIANKSLALPPAAKAVVEVAEPLLVLQPDAGGMS